MTGAGPAARYAIAYGKSGVPVYRTGAAPLEGVAAVPESPFAGRSNTLLAHEVDVEVFGDNFLPAYTEGDNSAVVATDSMKNFVLRQALEYGGGTLEGYLDHLGRRLLATYPQMEALRVAGRELRFDGVAVPTGDGGFAPSDRLVSRVRGDHGVAELALERQDGGAAVREQRSGRVGLELLKVTGSAFTHFVRDEYTTLPERRDRALFVALDVHWRYGDGADATGAQPARYVASEQVRDVVASVFHEFVSESIQHLVHEMGTRLLARFPPLAEVSFEASNLTRDPVAVADHDDRVTVSTDPFPAAGTISLTMSRPAGAR